MPESPTSAADADDDVDDFVVHTITAQDGTVENPDLTPSSTSAQKPIGLNHYEDTDSSSSDSSSDSETTPQNPPNTKIASSTNGIEGETKREATPKRKRVRFANDTIGTAPPAKMPKLQKAEEAKGTDEDGLDEDMAMFEAEVRVLDGGGEEADVDLAEMEDAREEALQEELRTRVVKMRERLRGGENGDAGVAVVTLAGEQVHLHLREKTLKPGQEEDATDDDGDEDDIDLMADWTEISK